jgi:hypothetical protein
MTINEALRQLATAKKMESQGRNDRIRLSTWLIKKGYDLNGAKAREARNKMIFEKYRKGVSFKEIAETVDVTIVRCRLIVHRMEAQIQMKKSKKINTRHF